MRIIGDIHGKIHLYQEAIKSGLDQEPDMSIQLGDFGYKKSHDWHLDNIDPERHKVLFGNHDHYPYLKMPHSLGDFHSFEYKGQKIFCMRGAKSVDQVSLIEGTNWFRNEEMIYSEWQDAIREYTNYKPDIVITHDCPTNIKQNVYGYVDHSITNQALQACFDIWEPAIWIHGHHHRSSENLFNGTLFKCLAEGEVYEI